MFFEQRKQLNSSLLDNGASPNMSASNPVLHLIPSEVHCIL